jgi:hypothetical protein
LTPPRFARWLVTSSLAPGERAAVLGDLEEEFADRAAIDERAARRWYRRQALRSAAPNFVRCVRNNPEPPLRVVTMFLLLSVQGVTTAISHRDYNLVWYWPIPTLLAAIVIALPPKIRTRIQGRVFVTIYLLLLPVTLVSTVTPRSIRGVVSEFVGLPLLAALFIVRYWPWWPKDAAPMIPPPAEFRVTWPRESDESEWTWLTVGVPNAPLGLSGLVLSRSDATSTESREWVRAQEPTIDRTFTNSETLVVNAAFRGDGTSMAARIDLVDGAGQIVRSVTPVVTADRLAVLPAPGLESVADVQKQVNAISAKLPLGDLAAGPYSICLTIVGANGTAHNAERVIVAPAARARS